MKHLIPIAVMVVGLVLILFWRGCSDQPEWKAKYDSIQVLYDARQVVEAERAQEISLLKDVLARKEATNAALEDDVARLSHEVKQGRKQNTRKVQKGDTVPEAGVLVTEDQWEAELALQRQQADLIDSLRATMKVMGDIIELKSDQLADYEIDKQELVFQKQMLQDEVGRLNVWYRRPKVLIPVAVGVGILTVIVAK